MPLATSLALCVESFLSLEAAAPPNYYDAAAGKIGIELRQALHSIIKGHTSAVRKFSFHSALRHRGFSDSKAGTLYGCSMLRHVSPLVAVSHNEVIHTARFDAALLLILGTWFGLVTAN